MKRTAKEVACEYVNKTAAFGASWTLVPIPGHSLALTALEGAMSANIARIYGIKPSGYLWGIIFKMVMVKLGVIVALKATVEVLNCIPIVGWFAKPVVAGSFIKLLGEALIGFFEERFPGQVAYEKPNWNSVAMAFGGSLASTELRGWYDSYLTTSEQHIENPAPPGTQRPNTDASPDRPQSRPLPHP